MSLLNSEIFTTQATERILTFSSYNIVLDIFKSNQVIYFTAVIIIKILKNISTVNICKTTEAGELRQLKELFSQSPRPCKP